MSLQPYKRIKSLSISSNLPILPKNLVEIIIKFTDLWSNDNETIKRYFKNISLENIEKPIVLNIQDFKDLIYYKSNKKLYNIVDIYWKLEYHNDKFLEYDIIEKNIKIIIFRTTNLNKKIVDHFKVNYFKNVNFNIHRYHTDVFIRI